ncbi:MAG: hypothetical protein H7Y00_16650, partial [Fimbriimonadaceae bacterium]|nr:hypothetical protein [Chitinophagales bacterium]
NFETQEAHAAINKEFENIYPATEAQLVVRQILGKPKVEALETGVALLGKNKWGGTGYAYWAKKLNDAGVFPTLKEITDNDNYQKQSPLIMTCAAGLLAEFLKPELLPGNFYAQYKNITVEKILSYENEWKIFLQNIKSETGETKQNDLITNINGFNFAHEGYQIYNGYGGTTAIHAVEKMKSIGTNSLAIIPYTGTGVLNEPTQYHFQNGAGGENDEAVIHSMYEAKKHSMTVLLKPQVWSWAGWTGHVKMENEADWKLFFDYYTKWIIHYAMLAEMYDADIFCAGVEFQIATTTHEEQWKKLFREIRKIYSGKLTYAANWGYEFETLSFWDELDYMSINCYYPLSDKKEITDTALLNSFEKILDNIERYEKKYNKPLLFTEIGFKSIDYPWIQPHADNDEQNVNELSQKRCYEAMFKAMEDETWISGIYLWQFPTYMDYTEDNPKGFTPCGKLAEEVVQHYFTKSNH